MNNNFLLLTPEFMVTGLAFLVLTLDFFCARSASIFSDTWRRQGCRLSLP